MNKEYGETLHNPFMKDGPRYESKEAKALLSDASLYIALVIVGSIVVPQAINRAGSIIKKEKAKNTIEDAG
jgi:hypothetical protein